MSAELMKMELFVVRSKADATLIEEIKMRYIHRHQTYSSTRRLPVKYGGNKTFC